MMKLHIKQSKISLEGHDILVQGCVNSACMQFRFSSEWDTHARIAVFTNGDTKVSVPVSSDTCIIPREVLLCPGNLYISLRGVGDGGTFVICTEDKCLGKIIISSAFSEVHRSEEAFPNIFDTILAEVAALKAVQMSQSTSLFKE